MDTDTFAISSWEFLGSYHTLLGPFSHLSKGICETTKNKKVWRTTQSKEVKTLQMPIKKKSFFSYIFFIKCEKNVFDRSVGLILP